MLPDSIFQIFVNLFEYRCIKRTMKDNSCCYHTRTSYLSPERGADNCRKVTTPSTMSLHFNVLQGSVLTIIITSHTDTHPHL